jgi:hypothetical protein
MSKPIVYALSLAAVLLTVASSCDRTVCGDGTIERDGECVTSGPVIDTARCGAGTVIGVDGMCVAEVPPTVCGEGTLADVTMNPGYLTCLPDGCDQSCDRELSCRTPSMGKISFCGRLYKVEDETQLRASTPTFLDCGAEGAATDGPCELAVNFYAAIDYANNPDGTLPLQPEEFHLDDCGRFEAYNLPLPSLNFLAIGVEDSSATGEHRRTGVAFSVAQNGVYNAQKAYVVESATEAAWSTAAGLSPGFVDQGAILMTFYRGTRQAGYTPVPGVGITEGGATKPDQDWYFDDTDPTQRLQLSATRDSTGDNGSGLKIGGAGVVEHSGTGAEPSGCAWSSALARAIPGVLFVTPRFAKNGSNECL